MRLMCSQDPAAIETVKNELFKSGIVAEARNHPIAEALGVTGIELWVQDERDFYNAAKLYARLQESTTGTNGDSSTTPRAGTHRLEIEVDEAEAAKTEELNESMKSEISAAGTPSTGETEQASLSLLEKEIEEMLEREKDTLAERGSLRKKIKELEQAVAEGQAALTSEADNRALAEREHAQKLADLQSSILSERGERERAEEQFTLEKLDWQRQLKSREGALNEARAKAESESKLVQTQQTAMVELRSEITALDQRREDVEKALFDTRAEAALEREARLAAEDQMQRATEAQKAAEQQLLHQKELEKRMKDQMAAINSLCSRLQAKRVAMVEQAM